MPAALTSPTTADLRLYHGNDLDVLAELLARELAAPHPQGPLAADTVLIPQPSLRRWLQRALAERFGVAANLQFLAPGEYVQQLMRANLGAQPSPSLQRERLPWRLFSTLEHESPEELHATLHEDAQGLRRWELSLSLAQGFERYQAWRADWMTQWQQQAAPEDWQAALWQRIAHGQISRAGLIGELLRRERLQVPVSRLFVFACLNVSPDVLRLIRRSADHVPVHLFVPTPCRDYWGDVRTLQERVRAQGEAAFEADEHPLLASCGRAGREFIRLLFDDYAGEARIEAAAYAEPLDRSSLLGRMREDLLHRRAPVVEAPPPNADGSLQLHACATRLREVEVAHALIRDRLERHGDLQARQIAVLAPDLTPYAAAIEAVFGGATGTPHFVPYQLAQGDEPAPLLQAFLELLRLPQWRFEAARIEDCLRWPWLSGTFGLQSSTCLRLLEAMEQAGLRWAWDGAQRRMLDGEAAVDGEAVAGDDAFSWTFALRRLLLGHAAGGTVMLGGVAPLPRLESQDLAALDDLLRCMERLLTWRRILQRAHSASRWHALLREMLEELLPSRYDGDEHDGARERLLDALRTLSRDASAELQERTITLAVVRAAIEHALQEEGSRAPWLSGGVAISRMVPMRLIPYRMVVLLGMDAGGFPRVEPFNALDRLSDRDANARRLGDRDTAEDDRFLFLQILASSERELHLCYVESTEDPGASASPLLHEIEDCALALYASDDRDATRERIHLRHPDQPFDSDASLPWAASRWSLRDSTATADITYRHSDIAAPSPVGISQLRRFLKDPAAAFLQASLGVDSELRDERWQDIEPFAPDSLQRWQWQQRALALCIEQGIDDAAQLHRHLVAEAWLTADLGGFTQAQECWRRLQALNARRALSDLRWHRHTLELTVGAFKVQGEWQGWFASQPMHLRLNAAQPKHRLRAGFDALLLSLDGHAEHLESWSFDAGWDLKRLAPSDAQAAREGLQRWLRLWDAHRSDPLPLTADCALKYVEVLQKKSGDEHAAWESAGKLWPRGEDGDEARNAPSAAQRRLWASRSPFEDFDGELAQRFRVSALDFVLPLQLVGAEEDEG